MITRSHPFPRLTHQEKISLFTEINISISQSEIYQIYTLYYMSKSSNHNSFLQPFYIYFYSKVIWKGLSIICTSNSSFNILFLFHFQFGMYSHMIIFYSLWIRLSWGQLQRTLFLSVLRSELCIKMQLYRQGLSLSEWL